NMLEELLIHKPDDPIQYMINHLKHNNDDAPRICVLGPPASGKTTVAMWLCKRLDAIRISRETLLFKEILALTKEAKAYKERKQKIPNALWANLIQERLSNVDCIKQGWILEGFPENQEQAWMLQSSGIIPRHVVVLCAPDTVLIERNSGKRLDPVTEEVYHTTFDWPSDPLVQQRLVEPEDLSEQEMSTKLLEYHRNFPEVFQIYQKILKSINADQPCVDVLSQVLTFVQTRHRSAAPFTPRILFCGPPGSGKSLQAALIAQKYSVVNICCGQLLKEAVAEKTKLGELVKPYIDNGYPAVFTIVIVTRVSIVQYEALGVTGIVLLKSVGLHERGGKTGFNVDGRHQEKQQGETQDWEAGPAVGDLEHLLAPAITDCYLLRRLFICRLQNYLRKPGNQSSSPVSRGSPAVSLTKEDGAGSVS
ncbi:PREDICTED: adenylate kinase 8, partial [Tauraco erythrolophus]|uniref:adenylate kinase 8 n=1 Tax=Tauraco erythrolophus TaxID=121530 RepID=UPI000523F0C3